MRAPAHHCPCSLLRSDPPPIALQVRASALPGSTIVGDESVFNRTLFIAMPRLRCSLAAHLRSAEGRAAAMPLGDVKRLAYALLSAVAHLKRHRIVHRDIKPDNVLLSELASCAGFFRYVLADFGDCLDCNPGGDHWQERYDPARPFRLVGQTRTNAGAVTGSPNIQAPEVKHGATALQAGTAEAVIDFEKADEWQCGIILHRVLSTHEGTATDDRTPLPYPTGRGDEMIVTRGSHYRPPNQPETDSNRGLYQLTENLLKIDPAERCTASAGMKAVYD